MHTQKPIFGHLAAFVTISIWGITFISIKILLVDFSPAEILFFRLVFALLALFIVSPPQLRGAFTEGQPGSRLRLELKYMAAGLCGVTLFFMIQNTALSYTQASNVSVLLSVAPLFTALAARVFLKDEPLKTYFFLGFALAMSGILLIAYNGSTVLKLNPLGDLLAILAAGVWALYSVLVRKISASQTNLLATTRKTMFYGLLFLLPFLPLFHFQLGLSRLRAPLNLINLLFLGLGASALCYISWNYAVSVLGAMKTSVYIYLGPVITIVSAVLLLREKITLVGVLGVGLILAGMVLSERQKT